MQWTVKANGRPSRWISPIEFAALRGTRAAGSSATPSWEDWLVDGPAGAYVVPIMQVVLSNGQSLGNTHMETGNVDAGRVWKSVGSGTGVLSWYDVALPSTVTLNAATTYDVVFTPQGSSTWVFADQRNGSAYGFGSPAAFTESQAEVLTGGSWLKANHWSHGSSDGGSNWRMTLHTAS